MQVIREAAERLNAPSLADRWAIRKRLLALRCKLMLQVVKQAVGAN
jgi:hypothetical protein